MVGPRPQLPYRFDFVEFKNLSHQAMLELSRDHLEAYWASLSWKILGFVADILPGTPLAPVARLGVVTGGLHLDLADFGCLSSFKYILFNQ